MTFRDRLGLTGAWIGVQSRPTGGRMVHAFVGAVLGMFMTALVMRQWAGGWGAGHGPAVPLLAAPIGASAVLLFGVPASPLAQPWAIVGGNTVSALCGVFWARTMGDAAFAAPLAVASAIVMMSLLRCLHPPGGAVALTCVIGGPAVIAAGWSFALVPVAANCLLLVGTGWLFNAASGGNYPHQARHHTAAAPEPVGYTMADLDSVLAQYDDLLDVSSEDLDALFRQVESRAYRRLHGVIRCERIMRAVPATLAANTGLEAARALWAEHRVSLPVVDRQGHVEGLLTSDRLAMSGGGSVRDAMDVSPCLAAPDTAIDALLPILSGGVHRQALVVDRAGRLLGMIEQTDLLSALWRGHIAEEIAQGLI